MLETLATRYGYPKSSRTGNVTSVPEPTTTLNHAGPKTGGEDGQRLQHVRTSRVSPAQPGSARSQSATG
jgi:hypothetical protein